MLLNNIMTNSTARSICLGLTLAFATMLAGSRLYAQDIHFSQYGNSPLNLNPALAGVFGGDMRFVGNFRQQWRTIPVPYTTFSGSVENKMYWDAGRYDRFLTGSLLVNYDRQGDLNLTSLQIGIPISVVVPVGETHFFSIGATPMFGQRSFNTSRGVTFDEQYVGRMFDPNAVITENLSTSSLKYFDLSAGANFRIQASQKRTRLDIGGAMHHINRPAHDFWASSVTGKDDVRLYNKLSLYGLGLFEVNERFDLLAQGLFQQQGKSKENVFGIGVRMHLNPQPYRELSLQIGVDYRQRFNNAIVPRLDVFYRTWALGFTFDWDALSRAGELVSRRRGGPELSLIHRLYRVKPIKYKSCTII